MTQFLDTHCHLDRYPRPLAVINAAATAGVTIVAVTELPSTYQALTLKLGRRPGVIPALGLHPLRAAEASRLELSLLQRLLPRAEVVGEVGLDFSRDSQAARRRQLHKFEAILGHTAIRSKVLTVHSRRAEAETITRLADARAIAVLHWYSGPANLIDPALDAGLCFSVNPAMLNSRSGLRVLDAVPADRILTETDGPYVQVSGRAAGPTDVPAIVNTLAKRWRMSPGEAAARIEGTFKALRSRTVSGQP